MFLHIGDNNIIKTKNIIGIFDKKIFQTCSGALCAPSKEDYNGEYKTIIITDKEKYFSNISVSTIFKRINHN